MGSVWVADHLRLGTQVAVKFLSPKLAKEAGAIVRFQDEAMSAAQIKSPHVVQVFDHGVFAGERPYIVMELLEGEDLGQRLDRTGPLPLVDLARLVVHVCRALRKAHAAGIVHRDIKPGNVFLSDQDGELFAKVLDFGIARRADAALATGVPDAGSIAGTPLYMSPEQLAGLSHVDFRTDLWSLGVMTYHCLVGRAPFEGVTVGGVCVAIERGAFEPPSRGRTGVTPALDAWFLKALSREPAARFGSARQMADAFVVATGVTPADSLRTTISGGPRDSLFSLPEGLLDAWQTTSTSGPTPAAGPTQAEGATPAEGAAQASENPPRTPKAYVVHDRPSLTPAATVMPARASRSPAPANAAPFLAETLPFGPPQPLRDQFVSTLPFGAPPLSDRPPPENAPPLDQAAPLGAGSTDGTSSFVEALAYSRVTRRNIAYWGAFGAGGLAIGALITALFDGGEARVANRREASAVQAVVAARPPLEGAAVVALPGAPSGSASPAPPLPGAALEAPLHDAARAGASQPVSGAAMRQAAPPHEGPRPPPASRRSVRSPHAVVSAPPEARPKESSQ